MRLFCYFLPIAASCVLAGEMRIGTPRLGFVLGGSGTLQTVEGIAGASWIGPAVPGHLRFQTALVSPRQDYVLGVTESGELIMKDLGTNEDATVLLAPTAKVALSPTGAAAAAYSSDERAILVWTGMPRNASAQRIALTGIEGDLGALAVSDDGSYVLAAFRSGEADALYRLHDGESELISKVGSSVVAFLPGKHQALVADTSSGNIFVLRTSLDFLAAEDSGVAAIATSADGTRLFVATTDGVRVIRVDGAGELQRVCDCSPAALERLNDSNLFRLTDAARGTLWLFDGRSGQERVFFVPAEVR